ncbi:hypothetical protein A8709_01855 [Paenibacillus pectinilyticus]|uniref:Uncharacterized protein n=1 Tax=Paenibacillus pectinilyticus TaxID=512399 RepID=A0A1C1A6M8_9BACL|nr:hypothetical protein [Paenibacillus pectinilyticus]OCT16210.1 hypothetical protein A8709_01855 [Paenibacillus pectinilyticus]
MTKTDSSLQSQNPISSAQNSVDNVHQAVKHALSHPTAQTTEDAQNAISKAGNAVSQASAQSDSPAVQQAMESLDEDKERLANLE